MTLKSMTGYGSGETESQGRVYGVEVRSVNNRFLDAKIKLPRGYTSFEAPLREMLSSYHQRGRVDLIVTVSGDFSDLVSVRFDTDLARSYKCQLIRLAGDLGLTGQPDLAMIVDLPDVVTREQHGEDPDQVWPHLSTAAQQALEQCLEMRRNEAAALCRDLTSRLRLFAGTLATIEEALPVIRRQREASLRERLDRLLEAVSLDPVRFEQEIAIMADKADVTEELVRLRSHIDQFEGLLQGSEPVGRKLDFLIQEFLREVNTLAAKVSDADIAHTTVSLKSELEKMREQVQNIE